MGVLDKTALDATRTERTLWLDGRPAVVAHLASTWRARARGLLFRRALLPGEGMLLVDCRSVHTWLMRYTIDVVYLDADLRVVKVAPRVRRWRFSVGGRRARHALELTAGDAERIGLVAGARLTAKGTGERS